MHLTMYFVGKIQFIKFTKKKYNSWRYICNFNILIGMTSKLKLARSTVSELESTSENSN